MSSSAIEERISRFAMKVMAEGQRDLKSPDELFGACVLVIASSLADDLTESQVAVVVESIAKALNAARGFKGHIGGTAN